jgi:peptide/nickel transport system permease protein
MPIYNPNPKTWTEAFAIYAVPAMAVGFRSAALTMRITRSSMLEVLRQDYIRTARAKGLPKRRVVFKHALFNALIPIVTSIGITVSLLISGSVVTETLFSIPGVGQLLTQAVLNRDYPTVQGGLLVTTALLVLVNIGMDLCYALLDPRVRDVT